MNRISSLELHGRINAAKFTSLDDFGDTNINSLNKAEEKSFKGVMFDLAKQMNSQINAPDEMLTQVMAGNPNVDIHDVMIALTKADLGVNIATNVTTKVLQSYEKIMQIQL